mgnify:CR=1 FL=1
MDIPAAILEGPDHSQGITHLSLGERSWKNVARAAPAVFVEAVDRQRGIHVRDAELGIGVLGKALCA